MQKMFLILRALTKAIKRMAKLANVVGISRYYPPFRIASNRLLIFT